MKIWIRSKTSVSRGALSLAATTNLIDGAKVRWEIGRALPEDVWRVHRSGKATVRDGRLNLNAKVSSIPGRTLYVFLEFSPVGQSAVVEARYGETGQYLRGDHQEFHGDYRTIEYWVKVRR